MMVTFVAQCEKKALNKSRRVLDAFANRIGSRTWQTVITSEGLRAVKKLLRQSASKNTAVSCHWIRSRSRSELIWIVGNRSKFNHTGYVPVNTTQQNIINTQWENDYHYLPLVKSLVALAGLFHDWGKSSEFFQTKLQKRKAIGDPLRHEWMSALFLHVYVDGETDEQWLTRLANKDINTNELQFSVLQKQKIKNKPLTKLPDGAALLAWLILSHHRLPLLDAKREKPAETFHKVFKGISSKWGYENKFDDFAENLPRCFSFPEGLPCDSAKWLNYASNKAQNLLACLDLLKKNH